MALIFIEGFEDYGATAGIQPHWEVPFRTIPSIVSGRFSGSALERPTRCDGSTTYRTSAISELFTGMAIRLNVLPSVSTVIGGFKSSNDSRTPASISVLSDGSVQISIDGNLQTSATGVITSATWHYIELHILTGSTFECRVDEIVVATFSGSTGAGVLDQVYLFNGSTSHDTTLTVDDMYVSDSEYVGSIRIDSVAGTMADAGLGAATVVAVRPVVPTVSQYVSIGYSPTVTYHTPPADLHTVSASQLEWTSLSDSIDVNEWDLYEIGKPPPEPEPSSYRHLMPIRSTLLVEKNPNTNLAWTPLEVDTFSTTHRPLDKV